jgi:hypothetical protein
MRGIEIRAVAASGTELRRAMGFNSLVAYLALAWRLVGPLGLLFLFVVALRHAPDQAGGLLTGVFAGTVALAGIIGATLNLAYRHGRKRAPLTASAVDWSLDENEIRLNAALFSSRLSWGAVTRVEEQRDRFVFQAPPDSSLILPKRALNADQLLHLRTLIAEVRASGRLGAGVD